MSSGFNKAQVLELTDRILHSWWTLVVGPCLGLAAALAGLHYLPKTYEASTTIFVAPPQIPQDFVRSTVTDDMSIRLASLREAVLSRPYLENLINETFGRPSSEAQLEGLMNRVRSRVQVSVRHDRVDFSKTGGVFNITYRDSDPARAANVVNTLVKYYVKQNVTFRTEQAEGTTKTIQSLASEVAAQLEAQQKRITDFKAQHLYETQDQYDGNVQKLQGRQHDLEANEIAAATVQDRLASLRLQASQAGGPDGTAIPDDGSVDPHAARVARLRRELEALRAKYHEEHPEVRAKKRELDEALAQNAAAAQPGPGGEAATRPLTPIQAQILNAERELARLQAEHERIRREIQIVERRIEATPRVEQELAELTKGFDVLQAKYRDYSAKAEDAKGAQRIEESQKGERFEVIETATPPAIPVSPVPLVVYAIGAAIGLAVFVGPIVVRSLLFPTIYSEAGLKELGNAPILVSVPRLQTAAVVSAVWRQRVVNIGCSLAALVVLVVTAGIFR